MRRSLNGSVSAVQNEVVGSGTGARLAVMLVVDCVRATYKSYSVKLLDIEQIMIYLTNPVRWFGVTTLLLGSTSDL
jgi:hypothetical protein